MSSDRLQRRRGLRRLGAAAAVGVLLGTGGVAAARAQEPEATAEATPVYAETTEVTATAVAEERRDVPATVRVVDGAEASAR